MGNSVSSPTNSAEEGLSSTAKDSFFNGEASNASLNAKAKKPIPIAAPAARPLDIKAAPILDTQALGLPPENFDNISPKQIRGASIPGAHRRLIWQESLVAGSPLTADDQYSVSSNAGVSGVQHFRQRSISSVLTPGSSEASSSLPNVSQTNSSILTARVTTNEVRFISTVKLFSSFKKA
jgi:hypothetical protein